MKMTLSSPSNLQAEQRQSGSSTNLERTPSPSSSPRSSPRPSPRPQTKREHGGSDSYLCVNYVKEPSPPSSSSSGKPATGGQGSPDVVLPLLNKTPSSTVLDSIATPPVEFNRSESTGGSSTKDRKDGRVKKKSSWFNSFYPTYKSRSEDFKRIFKDVPDDERLVVDYSCALQKEILVHGRLYVSQNYLCFYANIFGWGTNVTLKWKDVSAITKEKTALVIPNAVLICTRSDKYFFTSFVARDKTYLMLFRVWQNALLDQPMSPQEMWQWVHQCYGEELGLTSDDEDYIAPLTEEDKLSARLSLESFSEQECGSNTEGAAELVLPDERQEDEQRHIQRLPNSEGHIPTDMSDTTESDAEKTQDGHVACTTPHDGKILISEVFPMHIDQLFTLLFTNSKFFLDFHASRRTTDLTQTPWTHNPVDNSKSRIITSTLALNQTVGPKTTQATETQVMNPCSKAGHLYSIDTEAVNAGIPYAESFTVWVHYCLQKLSENQTTLSVYAQVRYKKSVWGLVKGMIEKSCWQGLEDFFTNLAKALHAECEEAVYPAVKRKSRKRRRVHSLQRSGAEESLIRARLGGASTRIKSSSHGRSLFNSDWATLIVFSVLLLLVILNVMLYYKLWSLEEAPPYTILDLHVLKNPPKSHDEWIKLLQQQETLHTVEIQKWQRILNTAITLLKQTEESLNELQRSIHPTYTEKMMSVIQSQKDMVERANEEL